MNDINEMPPKCQYCPYWEVCEYPWVCPDREQLATKLQQTCPATDTISRQAAIDTLNVDAELLRRVLDETDIVGTERAKYEWGLGLIESNIADIKELPSAQPERTCVNCGRTANNGGWYADGGTRCPIEEHYALPKDGYCHLWEKRNVTDDDYPERREE